MFGSGLDVDQQLKMMFGHHTIRVPAWMAVQHQANGLVSFCGASQSELPRFGSEMPHQLMIGELVLRPHVVIETEQMVGQGLSGILTTGLSMEDWARGGNVICDPAGKLKGRMGKPLRDPGGL